MNKKYSWSTNAPRLYHPSITEKAFGKGAEYGFRIGGAYDDRYNTFIEKKPRDAFKRGFNVGVTHRTGGKK